MQISTYPASNLEIHPTHFCGGFFFFRVGASDLRHNRADNRFKIWQTADLRHNFSLGNDYRLLSYGFDDNFIIALMQDHQTRDSVYWIITKKDNECLAFADSASFRDAMNDRGINLSLKEFPRYYKNLGSRELWHRRK